MPAQFPEARPHVPLAPITQFAPPDAAPIANATERSTGVQQVLQDIAGALRANLDRGFLEREGLFREMVEAFHDIVALTDANYTQLHFVNAAYETIWGRSRADLYANPLAFLDGVHPDDRERVREAIIGASHREYEIEFRVLRPAGDLRWVCSRGSPVRNAAGEICGVAAFVEDITDRKHVVDSHERLIRGFTHDVKNPLGAADGYLSLLELGVFGEMSTLQTDSVQRARRSIRSALDLVTNLLEIERAKAGEVVISRERVDLGDVARGVVEAFRPAGEAKQLSLSLLPPRHDESLVVESDGARVRQILANLVSNAVKYTQVAGHITVRAHVAEGDQEHRRGRWLAVTVADNGPGIPLDKQHLLFREFARFAPDAAEGSGIGLAISQHLARALGGTITCESTAGVGSAFTLWLPEAPPPSLKGQSGIPLVGSTGASSAGRVIDR